MNYPLISEYVEAIKLAEDNFEELSYLRPVLDGTGQPVMSSGNFAVVFKMRDERDGKLYAVRCFHRDQEGREESYRLIEEELKDVESPYLVSFRYIDKELFVDSSQTDETEFPVLLMDWVEGITLDKYLRENLDDQYALEMLAYRFSQLAQWLIPQPFAHGDLKPDNILVREDGTLVLVDYDGMYVPAMKGQKARELGSPDFRHPLRTENDFDEHIDDFPLASILLSLKAISLNPQLLEEYGATDRLLFSEIDYRNIASSSVLRCLLNQIANSEISRIYSLFIIVLSEKVISDDSYKLVFTKKDKVNYFESYKKQSKFDSDSKYCYSCLLMNGWGCNQNVNEGIHLIEELAEQGFAKAQFKLGRYYELGEGVPKDIEKAISWYTNAAEQGDIKALYNLSMLWFNGQNVPRDYEKVVEWLTKAANQGLAQAQYFLGNLSNEGIVMPQDYGEAMKWFRKAADQGYASAQYGLGYLYATGRGVPRDYGEAVKWFRKAANQGYASAQYSLGSHYAKGKGVPQDYGEAVKWFRKATEQGDGRAKSRLAKLEQRMSSQKDLFTKLKDEDFANAWTDEYGALYSADRRKLLRVPKEITNYTIREGTLIIGDAAFCSYLSGRKEYDSMMVDYASYNASLVLMQIIKGRCDSSLCSVTIPNTVQFIGDFAFCGCQSLAKIVVPPSVTFIGRFALSGCVHLKKIELTNPHVLIRDNPFAGLCCKIEIANNRYVVIDGKDGRQSSVFSQDMKRIIHCGYCDGEWYYGFDYTSCDPCWSVTRPPFRIPLTVEVIGSASFACCMIGELIIPKYVTKIEDYAFWGITSMIEELYIPPSVQVMGHHVFEHWEQRINVPRGNRKILEQFQKDNYHNIDEYDIENMDGYWNE